VSKTQILDELDRVDSEESLGQFIDRSWSLLEPGREYIPGWHIDAICEHLEAVTAGQITRLLINIPPGCMKSLTTNVFWPAWEWGPSNRPDLRYVSASYSEALTIRDNRRCRTLIRSEWYQRLWGDRFQIIPEQDTKIRYDNDRTGFKIATSVGGLGTGERGDRWVIDDPHNIKDGESDLKREGTILWLEEVVPTRVNDPELSAIVMIMQRVHDRDSSGVVLSKELGYTHLMLPMKFEEERKCFTKIGFEDPRTEDGELLWPKRMTRTVVERDEKAMTAYATASQMQQRPAPRGGGMVKRKWFEVVDKPPKDVVIRTRGWDLAATEKLHSAYTAGVRMSRGQDGFIYVEHVMRERASPGRVEEMLRECAKTDGFGTRISIPQDPGQAGKAQVRYLIRGLAGYVAHSSPETGNKETRFEPFAAQAEAGNIRLVRGLWNDEYLDELCIFPYGEFKDQADATSRAFTDIIPKTVDYVPSAPKVIHG
jgi:predicted phage terminase large subunit-like protein